MRSSILLLLLFIMLLSNSCRFDFETPPLTTPLEFSQDTVFLDTLFGNLSSATYAFKVYNRTGEAIHIPEVSLAHGADSEYRLNVDGRPGTRFQDVEILARDSIFIFVEGTVDPGASEHSKFLYTDYIQFKGEGMVQKVPVVALVKKARLLFPNQEGQQIRDTMDLGSPTAGEIISIKGFYLQDDQLHWTPETAWVIYGYAIVPSGKTLTIEAGTRIYFHADSGILVQANASLHSNGAFDPGKKLSEKEVVFQGDRLQETFSDTPGQWGGIWLQKGSLDNRFAYSTIKNAQLGIFAEGTDQDSTILTIENSQIYNSSINGLRGLKASISAKNLVVNNSGQASVHLIGGNGEFRHCTLTNYWDGGMRYVPAVSLENSVQTTSGTRLLPLSALFSNCILYGNQSRELSIETTGTEDLHLRFQNCLIRQEGTSADELNIGATNDPPFYHQTLFNRPPLFVNPARNNLKLQRESPARNQADPTVAAEVPFDILHHWRLPDPDMGAYEWTTNL